MTGREHASDAMPPRPRVLMVAYHYPPYAGSSGIHRTLYFSRYLPEMGWDPVMLVPHPRAYSAKWQDQLGDIPKGVSVHRAFAIDSSRHLAVRGRYLRLTALPDRWVSWVLGAVPTGLRLIRRLRPAAIWSTYPIATAHLIGLILHRLTGLPWIADFRDPMMTDTLPTGRLRRRVYAWVERSTVTRATCCVYPTPGAVQLYRGRFPSVAPDRFVLLPNGYDETPFLDAERDLPARAAGGPTTLVHSGLLYPSERDPRAFFDALARMKSEGAARGLRIVLRAGGHDDVHGPEVAKRGIGDLVEFAPPLPYREALREMLLSDGLLLFQASNSNAQVPAKLYEYFRAGRPVFAMTDPKGDTAAEMRAAGLDTIVPLDDGAAIARGLTDFLARVRAGTAPVVTPGEAVRHSRRGRTEDLVRILAAVTARA